MSVLQALVAAQGQADERLMRSADYAANAWGGMMESRVYKAAGKDLINLMETTPPDKDITAVDIMKIAQKWKLSESSMQKLMDHMKASGALDFDLMQRKAARMQLQDKEAVRRAEPDIKRAMTQSSMESAMNQLNSLYPGKPGDEDYLPLSGILEPMKTMSEINKINKAGELTDWQQIQALQNERKIDAIERKTDAQINALGKKDKSDDKVYPTTFVDDVTGLPMVIDRDGNMRPATTTLGTKPVPRPSALTPESAAKARLIKQAVGYMPQIKKMYLGSDPQKPVVDKGLVATAELRIPKTRGRQASTLILDAVEAKLRAESGAAVPKEEVARMAKRFIPSALDSDETVIMKLNNLEGFLSGTQELMDTGRGNKDAGGMDQFWTK